jgi:hypothetical protein
MSIDNQVCPTDGVQLNETSVRLVAGFVLLTAMAFWFSGWLGLPLGIDFGLRSSGLRSCSPFGYVAGRLVNTVRLPYKGHDHAPNALLPALG